MNNISFTKVPDLSDPSSISSLQSRDYHSINDRKEIQGVLTRIFGPILLEKSQDFYDLLSERLVPCQHELFPGKNISDTSKYLAALHRYSFSEDSVTLIEKEENVRKGRLLFYRRNILNPSFQKRLVELLEKVGVIAKKNDSSQNRLETVLQKDPSFFFPIGEKEEGSFLLQFEGLNSFSSSLESSSKEESFVPSAPSESSFVFGEEDLRIDDAQEASLIESPFLLEDSLNEEMRKIYQVMIKIFGPFVQKEDGTFLNVDDFYSVLLKIIPEDFGFSFGKNLEKYPKYAATHRKYLAGLYQFSVVKETLYKIRKDWKIDLNSFRIYRKIILESDFQNRLNSILKTSYLIAEKSDPISMESSAPLDSSKNNDPDDLFFRGLEDFLGTDSSNNPYNPFFSIQDDSPFISDDLSKVIADETLSSSNSLEKEKLDSGSRILQESQLPSLKEDSESLTPSKKRKARAPIFISQSKYRTVGELVAERERKKAEGLIT